MQWDCGRNAAKSAETNEMLLVLAIVALKPLKDSSIP